MRAHLAAGAALSQPRSERQSAPGAPVGNSGVKGVLHGHAWVALPRLTDQQSDIYRVGHKALDLVHSRLNGFPFCAGNVKIRFPIPIKGPQTLSGLKLKAIHRPMCAPLPLTIQPHPHVPPQTQYTLMNKLLTNRLSLSQFDRINRASPQHWLVYPGIHRHATRIISCLLCHTSVTRLLPDNILSNITAT
ncbi:hypothetical protein J6590_004039 [Homalodisca vitripennis]|nr:hypothetical protein J6590_004039 [Homalodisca vitripennis]